jgi:hypothetical protein
MRRIPFFLLVLLLFSAAARADRDPDLTVGWISRTPSLDYVRDSPHPERDGWPAVGQPVAWVAHVRNWKTVPRLGLPFRWILDGEAAASGTVDLPASSSAAVELPWTWTFDRHRLTFLIDGDGENALTVFTDAISIGFYVEQGMYDFMHLHQPSLGVGANSFEDWVERHVDRMNEMAALAVYPETPNGVLDRFRIDEIVVVPDGALPLVPLPNEGQMDGQPNASTTPNEGDRSVDLQWGFPATEAAYFDDFTTVGDQNGFYLTGSLIHELGHARYLVDVYGWDVWTGGTDGSEVAITEGGAPVAGTPWMPSSGQYVHFTSEQGLMNQDYSFIDRFSAIAMNFIAGHRAIEGNFNDPENEGSFLNDLPAQNRLTIRNAGGIPIRDADVRFYQATGVPGHFITKYYDDVPDLELHSDANGQVLVGRCPFSKDGRIVHRFGESNVTAIVRVEKNGTVEYGFLESRLFNLAYWSGKSEFADHDLFVGLPLCFPSRAALLSPALDAAVPSRVVTLKWSGGGQEITGYRVWVASGTSSPRVAGELSAQTNALSVETQGRTAWWVETLHASCPPSRSAVDFFTAPGDERPALRVSPVPSAAAAPISGR